MLAGLFGLLLLLAFVRDRSASFELDLRITEPSSVYNREEVPARHGLVVYRRGVPLHYCGNLLGIELGVHAIKELACGLMLLSLTRPCSVNCGQFYDLSPAAKARTYLVLQLHTKDSILTSP